MDEMLFKVSSFFPEGQDGEIAAWTWLASVLGQTGLVHTMEHWDFTTEKRSNSQLNYTFSRPR